MIKKGLKVCFVVPRVSLIKQTIASFNDLGLHDIGVIWADHEEDERAMITIASAQTLIRREHKQFDVIFNDECDIRYKELLERMAADKSQRYIGLTATPFAPWLGNYYKKMIKAKSMKWLIENGRLAPYDVFVPSKPDLRKVPLVYDEHGEKDYNQAVLEQVMNGAQVVGDVVQNWLENGENRTTMALCVNVLHAGHMTNAFNNAGVNAEMITGQTPLHERAAMMERHRAGITKVLVSIETLTQGHDEPLVTCLINARPTKMKRRFVQGIGRVLRYLAGKRALIFDHSGSFIEHGMVEDITVDYLINDSTGLEERKNQFNEEDKPEKKAKECKNCHYMKPAGVYICPKCGHKPVAGQDVEVDDTRGLEKLGKKKAAPTYKEKEAFWRGLKGWQHEQLNKKNKVVKDGAISYKFKNKFGHWPDRNFNQIAETPSAEVRNFIKSQNIRYAKGMAKK